MIAAGADALSVSGVPLDLHSGTTYWQLTDPPPTPRPPLETHEECDVAVVGSGVTGALCAYLLTARGVNVVVVDRRQAGRGSTLASTALLMYAPDVPLAALSQRIGPRDATRAYQLGRDAVDWIERWTRELGDACGFARRRSLYLASNAADAAGFREEYEQRARAGLPVEFWDAPRLARNSAFRGSAAIESDGDAQIDPYRLTQRLLAAAAARGARVYSHTTVHRIDRRRGALALATDRDRSLAARHAIWAAGYESQREFALPKARLSSSFVIASPPLPPLAGWPERRLVWESARPYLYVRGADDDRVIVGGADEPGECTHAAEALLRRKCGELRRGLQRICPALAFEPVCCWGGTFAETTDGLPFIRESRRIPGLWFALAYGANGITFGAIAARIIAAAIAGERQPDLDFLGAAR